MAKRIAASGKNQAAVTEPQSFETALHRLEEIVTQLERAEAPLEKALALYEEGVKLSRFCSGQIKDAERRVEMLEDKNGELRGRPFPDPETAAKAETPDSTGKEEEIEDDTDDGEETPPRLF